MIGTVRRRVLIGLLLSAGNLHPHRVAAQGGVHEFREVHLGMEVRLVIAHDDARVAERHATVAFASIDTLDAILSDWRATSEVRRLESAPAGAWVPISAPLRDVLALALRVAQATDGAFDPTVGPLTELWREAQRTGRPIPDSARAAARARVGHAHLTLDSATSRLRSDVAGLRLDLGAIAKGWILDHVVAGLRDSVQGILAEAGGDIVVAGHPPGAAGWRIAVPRAGGDTVVTLSTGAVSTSGPTGQRAPAAGGAVEGHVMDPHTGRGAQRGDPVTVRADRGAVSDALSTALTMVPNDERAALAARFGVTIIAGGR